MLKIERLLYDYGIHVGQPPISQNHYLDLSYLKMCRWYSVIGIMDNPCSLPHLTNYSEPILCSLRLNVNRRADYALSSSVIKAMGETLDDANNAIFADKGLAGLSWRENRP